MDALTFFSRLERTAARGGRAIVVGRGPSARFLETHALGPDDLLIGYNLGSIGDRAVDVLFSTHDDDGPADDPRVVTLEQIANADQGTHQRLYIGSIRFGLSELLIAIDHVAKHAPLTLILIGFDFRAATSDDDILKSDRRMDNMQRQIDVNAQRDVFFKLKPTYPSLRVIHAGFDRESDADPRSALTATATPLSMTGDVEIVAEVTTNHFGDPDRLFRLIRCAAAAGADSVKLQARDVNTFYTADKLAEAYESPFGKTFADYRHAIELSDTTIAKAQALATSLGLTVFFSALDEISFRRLRGLGIQRLKLPSTISEHRQYLDHVASLELDELVISTGMTDQAYEDYIIGAFGKVKNLYLLHCISSYPTASPDANIAVVRHYWELAQKHPHIVPGYSSHDIGGFGCALAVAAGARMIEKHIKVGSNSWAHFDDTALDVEQEFPEFVRTIRAAARVCGSETKSIQASEHHKYRK